MTRLAIRTNCCVCVGVLLLALGLSGCGDPTFDPRAPVEFGIADSTGRLAFCEPFEATHLLVESRPSDNSEQWTTLLDAVGSITLQKGEILTLDAVPPGMSGSNQAIEEYDSVTVSVLVVAADESVQNLRGQFLIPSDGLEEGAWIDGLGVITSEPCEP